MKQLINSEKTVEVAELPFLLRLDIQQFSDDLGGGDEGEGAEIDETLDDDLDNPGTGDDGGGNNQEVADPEHTPGQDDKTNAAFAQMRREKEAFEQQIRNMDAMISQQYGESHGIHTFAEYQQAIEQQRRQEEMQQMRDAGLPDEIIEKLEKLDRVDEIIQQQERENFNRMVSDGYNEIQKEYPELVKSHEDISDDVLEKWRGGETGLSLLDAYELVNKQAIRDHLRAASKQSALNQVNSKSHLRGNGGDSDGDVDLTSIPSDVLATYKQMFSKELRTGKMKLSDFVDHYKRSNK